MTKEKFICYEDIRLSGVTNMFDVNKVIKLSDNLLDKKGILDIMKNYRKYYDEFMN